MRDAEPTTNDEAQRYCMSSLFYPATALMVRLRVSRKFMVAGAPALVLLLALASAYSIRCISAFVHSM